MVDFWHGESVRDAPLSQRKALFFQHPKNGILFISRLIYVPNVQPGIPGLILDHFLLDSMHGLEQGVLPNYEGAVLNKLGMGSFFGNPAEEDQLDINMQRSFTSWWESHGMDMNEHKPNLEWH